MLPYLQIRNDKSIPGFKFGKIEIKLTSFADDLTFLVNDTQSLRRILKLIKIYGIFSSLIIKMNVEKCEACCIGRSKGDTDKPVKCKWISLTNNTIKILGTHFSDNKLLEKKMNFYSLVIDCWTLLNIWKQRWLSLAGKIQVFKSFIASKPVDIATMNYIYFRKLENKSGHFVGFKVCTRTIMKVEKKKYLREKVCSLCTTKNGML